MLKLPAWLTDRCFDHACSKTNVRDADEYTRRFKRLRHFIRMGIDDSTNYRMEPVGVDDSRVSIEYAVASARVAFGAAMEVVASASAMLLCDTLHTPVEGGLRAARLSWLCHDSYMAALWTDAHANYMLDTLSGPVAGLRGPHISRGVPCIARTTSISMLPNISAKFEAYCASQTLDVESKRLLSVLFRCGQSGSRGWDSALKDSLASDGAQWVLHKAFKACLIGMHPQLHPSARPDWTQRAMIVRLLEERMSIADDMNHVISSCGTATKESIRLYMCSILHQIPATRSALATIHSSIGLLRSAPGELVPGSLASAAQNIVAAGTDLGEMLHTNSCVGRELVERVKSVIQARIGSEPRVRSRSIAHAMCQAQDKLYSVVYNPSWFGRAMGGDTTAEVASNMHAALPMIHELVARAFRAQFVPFWIHGHGHNVRTSRLDESQHAAMRRTSALQRLISDIDAETILFIQRLVLRTPTAATSNLSEIGHLLGFSVENQALLDRPKTFEDAIAAVCELSPDAGSKLMLFGRIASLKNRLLSFSLGATTRKLQLAALKRRFEVECDDDDVISVLPEHSHLLYLCLECKRVPNACVDAGTKMVSHNEIGLAATMLRVGGVGDLPEVRCARRASAALRTALHKEDSAFKNRIELIEPTDQSIDRGIADNGDAAHAARLRRDLRTCSEQSARALACGDRPLVKISILGRAVRVNGKFYALCCFCASIVQVSQLKRYEGEICCCRCDASMLSAKHNCNESNATRVAVSVNTTSKRPRPQAFAHIFPTHELNCRFCNKSPPMSSTASRFKIVRAPHDNSGNNGRLPPPLRVVALCSSHWKPWVELGLQKLSMAVVFAHISEKAVPVFGAEENSRPTLTYKRPTSSLGVVQRTIMKRVRENRSVPISKR